MTHPPKEAVTPVKAARPAIPLTGSTATPSVAGAKIPPAPDASAGPADKLPPGGGGGGSAGTGGNVSSSGGGAVGGSTKLPPAPPCELHSKPPSILTECMPLMPGFAVVRTAAAPQLLVNDPSTAAWKAEPFDAAAAASNHWRLHSALPVDVRALGAGLVAAGAAYFYFQQPAQSHSQVCNCLAGDHRAQWYSCCHLAYRHMSFTLVQCWCIPGLAEQKACSWLACCP